MIIVDNYRLLNGSDEPSVHEGSQCRCLSTIPDKYQQLLATQSECYADIPEILQTAATCNDVTVRVFCWSVS